MLFHSAAHTPQRLYLDLADPLTGHTQFTPYFLQRGTFITAQSEAPYHDLALFAVEF